MPDHSAEQAALIRPERTLNPEFVEWGAWYVDDQVQVVFFDTEAEAQQYADYCIAADLDSAAPPAAETCGHLDPDGCGCDR